MQISREWSKSAATDSIDKVLSYWADDAVVMSPGEAPIKGKKAIREMVEGASKIQGLKLAGSP
jgi:ketosteroid isomerase-like protein